MKKKTVMCFEGEEYELKPLNVCHCKQSIGHEPGCSRFVSPTLSPQEAIGALDRVIEGFENEYLYGCETWRVSSVGTLTQVRETLEKVEAE